MAVVTFPKNTQMDILDHTGVGNKTYAGAGYQYGAIGGAIGGLIEGAIVETERATKIRKSLGGDPDLLKAELADFSIDKILYASLTQRLSKLYEVVSPGDLKTGLEKFSGKDVDRYIAVCKELGIDSLITITYEWGLAAYVGENASAAIDAEFQLWGIKEKKVLFKRPVPSECLYKKNRTMEELKENNGKIFREDISQAVNSVALQIASTFGIDADEAENKKVNDFLYLVGVTCDKPYKLTQDCSGFSGPKRTININGNKIKISGSEDGRVILLTSNNFFWHYAADTFTFGGSSMSSNANYKAGLRVIEWVISYLFEHASKDF